ncbi:alpha/beta-hydrolase [Xylariaceae sp. FL1272]|nr:alpha/beta-hydrolase [Xylariaceae sp. FL1272]
MSIPALTLTDHMGRRCRKLTVPVEISAELEVFDFNPPHGDIEATDFSLNVTRAGLDFTKAIYTDSVVKTSTYNIAATYCEPHSGPGKALQVLTHGIGFGQSYWDFPIHHHNYSYVNAALRRNYSTFSYDRLGVGESSHGDPVNEIQASLQISALQALTVMLRNTSLPGIDTKYEKVVHVGHSFGSILTYATTAAFPSLSDGIVLTGWSLTVPYGKDFIYAGGATAANSFHAWKHYPDGYLVPGTERGTQSVFFAPGTFDPRVLKAAHEAREPSTIGETIATKALPVESQFEGPVLVVTGERDGPNCGGNCYSSLPSIPASAKSSFKQASSFKAVIIPGAGHGLNLEYSWPTTYGTILDFFDDVIEH